MPNDIFLKRQATLIIAVCLLIAGNSRAQTDADAIMIPKNNLCTGVMYSNSTWKKYWEGDFKRENLNIGNLNTQMITVVGNYGITGRLNLMFNVPYVATKASGGTLKGMHGVQDLSMMLKWKPVRAKLGKGTLSVLGVAGFSMPLTNYVSDFLPMSIGLHSKNASARAIVDYQLSHWFVTVSGMYTRRSNIIIDRTAYYTTEMHYTNEVEMPDMAGYQVRSGLRTRQWIAEAFVDRMNTLGGFDIRKNDMPFPSNEMNATRAGINFKYSFVSITGLELTGGASHVLSGRNVGQSTAINAGILYIFSIRKKSSSTINK